MVDQKIIDDLNLKIKNASEKVKTTSDIFTSKANAAKTSYDSIMACKYKWTMPAFGEVIDSNGCDNFVSDKKYPLCTSQSSCRTKVTQYNLDLAGYKTAKSEFENAQKNLDLAKKNLQEYLKSESDINDLSPEEKHKKYIRKVVFSIIAGVIIITSVYFIYKNKNK